MWWYTYKQIIGLFNEKIHNENFYMLNANELRQPQRTLKETPFDENGKNLAAVLRRIKYYGGNNWDLLRGVLQSVIKSFNTLEVETVGSYLATKLLYDTDGTNHRTAYLGQESDGTIRMLGLLAALQQQPSQTFISIEEPEANIHPGALAALAGVIDEASLRSQILVTTHSPDMLDHLPVESFLVVEKVGDTTHVGPLDASQIASVRKRLFTPGELFRMEGLQRQTESAS
jgi:predicted ATPase